MFVSGSIFCADLLWLTFYRILGSYDVEIGSRIYWCSRILPRRPLGRLWPSCARRPGRATKGNCSQRNPFMWSVGKTEVSFWVGAGTGRAGAQGHGQGQGGFEDRSSSEVGVQKGGLQVRGLPGRGVGQKAIRTGHQRFWTGLAGSPSRLYDPKALFRYTPCLCRFDYYNILISRLSSWHSLLWP